jgi:hypothetical protein
LGGNDLVRLEIKSRLLQDNTEAGRIVAPDLPTLDASFFPDTAILKLVLHPLDKSKQRIAA